MKMVSFYDISTLISHPRLLGTLLSIHTREKGTGDKGNLEGSNCGCCVSMWLTCYSPGHGEEACASWDSPHRAAPDTKPGLWALKADKADVNVFPATLARHPGGYRRVWCLFRPNSHIPRCLFFWHSKGQFAFFSVRERFYYVQKSYTQTSYSYWQLQVNVTTKYI